MGNKASCCREEQLACIEQAVFDDTDEEDDNELDEYVAPPSHQLLAALELDRQENASRAAEDTNKGIEARFEEMRDREQQLPRLIRIGMGR